MVRIQKTRAEQVSEGTYKMKTVLYLFVGAVQRPEY
jgi:hypothetical protein